jgi:hypothetical protein
LIEPALGPRRFIHEGPPRVRRTFADAFRLVLAFPRTTLAPVFVVQVSVALATATAIVVLYATLFRDKPVVHPADVYVDGDREQQFWFTVLVAVEIVFAQVARGAAIIAVAGAARGRPLDVKAALDPAFTRLGGLLLIVLFLAMGAGVLVLTIVGIPIALYLAVRLALVFDCFMLEGHPPLAAFGRAWRIAAGRMLALTGAICSGLLAVLPVFIFGSALTTVSGAGRTSDVLLIAFSGVLQSALVVPAIGCFTAITTLFYLNLKANEHGRYAP